MNCTYLRLELTRLYRDPVLLAIVVVLPAFFFIGASLAIPTTLEPEGGFAIRADQRPLIPQLLSARWEVLNEGRLLVVTGIGPTKGYHDARLVTAVAQPRGRVSPDADGVLRLRFTALPPLPESQAARLPATAQADTITVALPLSHTQLASITRIEVIGENNQLSISR